MNLHDRVRQCRGEESSVASVPKVICIDDDPEISRTIELRLREYDVEVLRAFHGMHGFWLAMTERPDLIITDMNMPQGQGDYVVECLKRNAETRDIPVFVLTGVRDKKTRQQMMTLGVDEYFNKPYPSDQLIESIGRFVDLQPQMHLETV